MFGLRCGFASARGERGQQCAAPGVVLVEPVAVRVGDHLCECGLGQCPLQGAVEGRAGQVAEMVFTDFAAWSIGECGERVGDGETVMVGEQGSG